MKSRLKLSTKVYLICFFNVLLIGLAFIAFLRIQLRVGIESFMASPVHERLLSITREAALELQQFDPAVWDSVLARFGEDYRLQFHFLDAQGNQLAGSREPLPPGISVVGQELIRLRLRERMERRAVREESLAATQSALPEGSRSHQTAARTREMRSHAFRRTSENPTRYWVGIPVSLPGQEGLGGVLIAGTSSWRSTLLLFDFKPWLILGAVTILISVLCWLPFIRGLTKSIAHMTRATARIAEGQFDVQLPVRRRDELGQLSDSINRMSGRLARYVQGQKRFLGDVAHELCSPLARMQVALGILERSTGVNQQYLLDLNEDTQHMSSLVHELLSFSKASLKPAGTQLADVSVAATVARVLERESTAGITITTLIEEDESLCVQAEPELLFRALGNLVRNAVRYAGDAGPIVISAHQHDGEVTIRVADSGPGLPEKELETIFEPFYRLEAARDRESGGVGLGLAIVKTCIDSCQGAVRCRNRQPTGLEVEIRLATAPSAMTAVPRKQGLAGD